MISTFKENHPVLWRTGFIVLPFTAGIVTHLVLTAVVPSYPQSIRNFADANIRPLRDLPVITQILGPKSSTEPEPPIDTLMKHYAALKTDTVLAKNVNDPLPQDMRIPPKQEAMESGGATWNTTKTGDITQPPPLDVVNGTDGPLYQLAESTEADTRIRGLEALSDASGRQAVRACVEGLIDSDPTVRRHASHAIRRADREVLYREWVHVLQYGPLELLQAFDAEIPLLQEQLESHALAGLASGQSARIQKLAAMYTLGRIRSDAALPLLTGYAWSGDVKLGQTATAAIAEIRSPDAVGALTDLTAHYDADIRWYAVNGLGILKGEDALAALEALIENGLEPVQETRVLAVTHLGDARDLGSITTLIDAMARYPGLRYDAMYALSQITGIEDFDVPFQWKEWYKEWSVTPEAQAAARSRRQIPSTQVAVMPVETAAPDTTPVIEPVPAQTVEVQPAPPAPLPTSKPTPNKPLQVKRTGDGGSFGTSDLSPAELMRRGGFNAAKP